MKENLPLDPLKPPSSTTSQDIARFGRLFVLAGVAYAVWALYVSSLLPAGAPAPWGAIAVGSLLCVAGISGYLFPAVARRIRALFAFGVNAMTLHCLYELAVSPILPGVAIGPMIVGLAFFIYVAQYDRIQALEGLRKREEVLTRRHTLLLVQNRVSEIMAISPESSAAQEVAEELSRALEFPIVAVELYDPRRDTLKFIGLVGMPVADKGVFEAPADEALAGVAVRTGEPVIETEAMRRLEIRNKTLKLTAARTYAAFPLRTASGIIGVLAFADPKSRPVDKVKEWGMAIADSLAILLERKRDANRFALLNDCFLQSGGSSDENIRRFLSLCAETLGADNATFCQLQGNCLLATSTWNAPPGFVPAIEAKGQIAAEVIEEGSEESVTYSDLPTSRFAATDTWCVDQNARTYLGHAVRCHDGSTGAISLYFKRHWVPSHDDRKFLGVVASAIRLEEARRQASEVIQQQQATIVATSKFSALGEMASGIAHEINNPLAIIHAKAGQLADFAREGALDRELVAVAAEKIEATAMRISKIIRGLRSFARDGGKDPFENSQVKQMLEDTLEFCAERFRHHGVELQVGEIPAEISIQCRPSQVSEVLLNLLNNAFDAVQDLPEKWVSVQVRDLGSFIQIAITDSGRGIPPEIRQKILQPFFTTKGVGKGTGLGLSISKGILESHGGSLELDAAYPYTRFLVELPKQQKRAEEAA